jgi:signal peptidase II
VYRRTVFAVALAVLGLDQATKAWAVARLETGAPIRVIGSFVQLSFARNPGAAFSMGTGMTWVFTALAASVAIFVMRTSSRLTSRAWALCLGGVLGGALGNLTDRLLRSPGVLRGHVVDFIEFPHYPLFNVADSAVVCSAVAIAVLSMRDVQP